MQKQFDTINNRTQDHMSLSCRQTKASFIVDRHEFQFGVISEFEKAQNKNNYSQ
jgi:hypothetical protein